jgi:hypothetical protein
MHVSQGPQDTRSTGSAAMDRANNHAAELIPEKTRA